MTKTTNELLTPVVTEEPTSEPGKPIKLICKSFVVDGPVCTINLATGDDEEMNDNLSKVVVAHREHGRKELEFDLSAPGQKKTIKAWIANYSPWLVVLRVDKLNV